MQLQRRLYSLIATIVRADGLPAITSSGPPGTRINPYCIVRHGHDLLQSTHLSSTQNPQWNESLSIPCSSDGGGGGSLGDRAQLELWHSRNGLGPDMLIAVVPSEEKALFCVGALPEVRHFALRLFRVMQFP